MKKLSIALLLSLTLIAATACMGGEEKTDEGAGLGDGGVTNTETDLPDLPSTF